jgi:tetratricopeptide (TPR) repeat protein
MLAWLWNILSDPGDHMGLAGLGAIVLAAGAAIAAVTKGLWTVYKDRADRKTDCEKKGGATNATQSGQGAASGRDTTYQGPVNFGPSLEHIEQIQKPLVEQLTAKDAQLAAKDDLIKMLLERNPTTAEGPGERQAVGAAVRLITQGAEEGDARLQQALALLKDNKVVEAELLLKVFAEDKEARAEQASTQAETDRKEAAIAYRNLGAIAGLRDPKAAREAYAKAVALDPDNAEGLDRDGWFQLGATNLAAAEKSYRALLQLAGKGASEDQIFWARTGLGDIAVARGDLNAALAAYGEALAAMERLAGSNAGNANWQRDLSVSNNKIGDVLVKQGNLPEAEKSYRAGLAIRERLAGSDAGNADWQRDLSVSNTKIGDVLVKQGNLPEAEKSYRTGLMIAERLAGSDAGNADWQRDLSVSYDRVGNVMVKQGNLPVALKSYRAGLAIRERLAGSDAGNAEWQNDLSVSYEKVGDVQKAQGDLASALKSYRADVAITERLAKSDPGNAGWQRDLAISVGRLALAQKQSGDKAKARGYLRQGHEIIARLTKLSPDNAEWKSDLTWFDGQIKELGP